MYQSLPNILEAAQNALGARLTAVYDKSADVLGKHLQEPIRNRLLWGTPGDGEVLENGHRFKVDWVEGQKTGFFLDQRDNRSLLGKFAQGRSMLNTFCYSGGFSVYAHAAGAKRVVSVDVSKPAIALTDENIALNPGPGLYESHAADVFKYLEQHTETFDVVVLDPPAFAKHLSARHQALQGYKRLNALALQRMPAGSFLFTFSCSQVVDRNLFEGAVLSAAIQANRQVRIVHHLSQPADHAPSLFHPEGHYLKGLVLYVE
jgi:23S rRNA (cytosine1962-C5)-methyltransferase